MLDLFAQQKKMIERTTEFWQEVLSGSPWLSQPEAPFKDVVNRWIAGMRSAGDLNVNAWKSVMDTGEETFFKVIKESRVYGQALEDQLRENWRNFRKVQVAQRDAMEEFLGTIEKALFKTEGPS